MEVNVARDKDKAINSYLTDMLSLEEHIQKAVQGQLEDLEDYPEVTRDLRQVLHNLVPGAVLRFLREEGLPINEGVLPEVSRTIEEIWHAQSDQAPRAEETS